MSFLNTPTRKNSQSRKTFANKSTILRPSTLYNQNSTSENASPFKVNNSYGSRNSDSQSYNNLIPQNVNQVSRAGSRTVSRTTSRITSSSATSSSYCQQPSGFNSISITSTSTPQRNVLSRSTSRSSSRLSLSSIGTSSGNSSRIPSGTMYAESPFSSNTIGPVVIKNSRIQVTVRPKPLNINDNSQNTYELTPWNINLNNSQIENSEIGSFQYDHVFSTDDNNQEVFDIVALPVIEQCIDGYNGTIFAYGMTGSGKTYSMRGVVHKSVLTLFDNFKLKDTENLGDIMDQDINTNDNNNNQNWTDEGVFNDDTITAGSIFLKNKIKYITCSILEIYNEKLNDLLVDKDYDNNMTNNFNMINQGNEFSSNSNGSRDNNNTNNNNNTFINKNSRNSNNELRIVDDTKFGIKVHGLKEFKVTSAEQLLELIDQGERSRSIDSTDYNYRSSRSHFIIMLKLYLENSEGNEIVSTLNFCDLAGSERVTSHSDRRKEGGYINKSLLALGTVITKLSESNGNNSNAHIPYRDSKLTRILQPSLSGKSMVSILCTIQLGSNVVGETTNTLRFGLRARNVRLNVKQNTGNIDINKLIRENENLKFELTEARNLLELATITNNNNNNNNNNRGNNSDNNTEFRKIDFESKEDIYYELIAENNILNEQVEHLKRLQLEDNILRSQQCDSDLENLNNLLNELILDSATRKKSDELLTRIKRGLQEYNNRFNEVESYVGHLENRIRVSEIELARKKNEEGNGVLDTVVSINSSVNKNSRYEIIEEMQEEILELKQSMKRKDAMIRALQRVDNVSKV